MDDKLWVRGIRGAATVLENTPESIRGTAKNLLAVIARENALEPAKIISIIFSVTPDLDAAFPAEAARELGWVQVPLFCTAEIPVPGALTMCVRVLIHAYLACDQDEVRHVYLGDAVFLRPDLNVKNG